MIGKIKFYLTRFVSYVSLAQFFMVAYLFVKSVGLSLWWGLLAIPLAVLIIWVDYRYVVKGEIGEFFKQGGNK